MSLVSSETDRIIISHIFTKSQKWNQLLIHRIYYIFGKAQFNDFLMSCREHFLNHLYEQYQTRDFDVVIGKILGKKNVKLFDCYHTFQRSFKAEELTFYGRNSYHRLVIYYLSVYYGYIHICIKNVQHEKSGYNYYQFHEDRPGAVIPYHDIEETQSS